MWKGLFVLVALIGVVALTAEAQLNQKQPAASLKAGVVSRVNLKEATVDKILKALGPAIVEQLEAGRSVELTGVGTFQIIRVAEHKDLGRDGRPITVPARNFVEFAPSGELNQAANAGGAVPTREVKGYEFQVNPDVNPGIRTAGQRSTGIRTR